MLSTLIQTKKFPRLFLVQGFSSLDSQTVSMNGLRLVWPESHKHFESQVLDLSLSGIAIPNSPLLGKIKLGQSFELKLKLDSIKTSATTVLLKCRVVRMTAKMVGLVFESISSEGRLVLDQATKDDLVKNHLREFSTSELSVQLQSDIWIHGPFDTNFFVWLRPEGGLKQAVIEYDHLLWIYQDGKVTLERSVSASEETRGYLAPEALFLESSTSTTGAARVAMGASWLDRLLKLLESRARRSEDFSFLGDSRLEPLVQVLKNQRSQ